MLRTCVGDDEYTAAQSSVIRLKSNQRVDALIAGRGGLRNMGKLWHDAKRYAKFYARSYR